MGRKLPSTNVCFGYLPDHSALVISGANNWSSRMQMGGELGVQTLPLDNPAPRAGIATPPLPCFRACAAGYRKADAVDR